MVLVLVLMCLFVECTEIAIHTFGSKTASVSLCIWKRKITGYSRLFTVDIGSMCMYTHLEIN